MTGLMMTGVSGAREFDIKGEQLPIVPSLPVSTYRLDGRREGNPASTDVSNYCLLIVKQLSGDNVVGLTTVLYTKPGII